MAIDGEDVVTYGANALTRRLRGPRGSTLAVSIRARGGETRTHTLVRTVPTRRPLQEGAQR